MWCFVSGRGSRASRWAVKDVIRTRMQITTSRIFVYAAFAATCMTVACATSAPTKTSSAPRAESIADAKPLPPPAAPDKVVIVVDHAWVKDSPDEVVQASQRKSLERLRALVAAGKTIPAAYEALGIPGAAWHIGDHEEYAYNVIPDAAHDLPDGALSPIIAGDGGLHLFKIYARKTLP
jgi:hypothetical protein